MQAQQGEMKAGQTKRRGARRKKRGGKQARRRAYFERKAAARAKLEEIPWWSYDVEGRVAEEDFPSLETVYAVPVVDDRFFEAVYAVPVPEPYLDYYAISSDQPLDVPLWKSAFDESYDVVDLVGLDDDPEPEFLTRLRSRGASSLDWRDDADDGSDNSLFFVQIGRDLFHEPDTPRGSSASSSVVLESASSSDHELHHEDQIDPIFFLDLDFDVDAPQPGSASLISCGA
uniref:Uncharacterized protein n=1 Tax=Chrysocystis fragilis TaxID=1411660 RepID=A0A7S0XQY7_9STRA|mmetsp:Transcript_163/g.436  ORF Transcript_163/g.436 Transcript_163/m.436 type:complete len:230 (+) Transcript_163:69-758(+)